jgi:hypothetical protein
VNTVAPAHISGNEGFELLESVRVRTSRPMRDKPSGIYLVCGGHITSAPDLTVCAANKGFVIVQ